MEIGPIPGIRAVGPARARRAELEPPAIFDIDGASKPGDGVVERKGRKGAGAEENEQKDLLPEDEAEEAPAQKNVDYFA